MKNNWIKSYYTILGLYTALLLVCYSFSLLDVKVDTSSISLLIILISLPILFTIKKLKISGVEAEIRDEEIERLAIQVEKTISEVDVTLQSSELKKTANNSYNLLKKQLLQLLAEGNEFTAATMIRALLYEVVERMWENSYDSPVMMTSIDLMIERLININLIPKSLSEDLKETIRICNEITHGAKLPRKASTVFAKTASSVVRMMNSLSQRA